MGSLLSDVRYGVRMLLRAPGLSPSTIPQRSRSAWGLTKHSFSVVYGSVLRCLDFDNGTKLIALPEDSPSQKSRGNSAPVLDVLDWR
jgi:hypothetical protein